MLEIDLKNLSSSVCRQGLAQLFFWVLRRKKEWIFKWFVRRIGQVGIREKIKCLKIKLFCMQHFYTIIRHFYRIFQNEKRMSTGQKLSFYPFLIPVFQTKRKFSYFLSPTFKKWSQSMCLADTVVKSFEPTWKLGYMLSDNPKMSFRRYKHPLFVIGKERKSNLVGAWFMAHLHALTTIPYFAVLVCHRFHRCVI